MIRRIATTRRSAAKRTTTHRSALRFRDSSRSGAKTEDRTERTVPVRQRQEVQAVLSTLTGDAGLTAQRQLSPPPHLHLQSRAPGTPTLSPAHGRTARLQHLQRQLYVGATQHHPRQRDRQVRTRQPSRASFEVRPGCIRYSPGSVHECLEMSPTASRPLRQWSAALTSPHLTSYRAGATRYRQCGSQLQAVDSRCALRSCMAHAQEVSSATAQADEAPWTARRGLPLAAEIQRQECGPRIRQVVRSRPRVRFEGA